MNASVHRLYRQTEPSSEHVRYMFISSLMKMKLTWDWWSLLWLLIFQFAALLPIEPKVQAHTITSPVLLPVITVLSF